MKTPRELLLAQQKNVVPRLDAIRQNVIREHLNAETVGESQPAALRKTTPARLVMDTLQTLWLELFKPVRYAWSGLALVWVFILFLNQGTAIPTPDPVLVRAPHKQIDLMTAYKAQKRVFAQFENWEGPVADEPVDAVVPPPRSEIRHGKTLS